MLFYQTTELVTSVTQMVYSKDNNKVMLLNNNWGAIPCDNKGMKIVVES
jgi:hypothetical protein